MVLEDIEKLTLVRPSCRQLAWQSGEFYAFLHYGMNSFTNREWGTGEESPSLFSPTALDTDQWCQVLKSAQIKGVILTAKHHDGFCLWNTAYTDYSVMSSPLKRDIVQELSQSCKKHGLKMGIYLSPWDRHEKTYGTGKAYNDFFVAQLTELLSNYGELFEVWFDGACGEGKNGRRQSYDWSRYYQVIRSLQPNAVIAVCGPDVRWCGNEGGHCRKSEWSVVPRRLCDAEKIESLSQQSEQDAARLKKISSSDEDLGSREALKGESELIWYPAEVNTSIRPGWFYHPEEDNKLRSLSELKELYLNSAGGNTVLLLNIPPHPDGYIASPDAARLKELGQFLQTTFSENLLAKAEIDAASRAGYSVSSLLTKEPSCWIPAEHLPAVISIRFSEPVSIGYLVLKEAISESQRVENFEITAFMEGKETLLYAGQTIGYQKICPLSCLTDHLTIRFLSSRLSPCISFCGLYAKA